MGGVGGAPRGSGASIGGAAITESSPPPAARRAPSAGGEESLPRPVRRAGSRPPRLRSSPPTRPA
eukprot:2940175-Prymnesium_polylepis.1